MGGLPQDGKQYALMNAQHGKFLHGGDEDEPEMLDVRSPEATIDGLQRWNVNFVSGTSEPTITLAASGGPRDIGLKHSTHGATVKLLGLSPPALLATSIHQWILAAGDDNYPGFFRLMNVHTNTYLDISSNNVDDEGHPYLVGQGFRDAATGQMWKFIHIHKDWTRQEVDDHLKKAHHAFRLGQAQQAQIIANENNQGQSGGYQLQAQYYQQQQYSGPNLCGQATCGVDHICNADYNRIVQPMGYRGV